MLTWHLFAEYNLPNRESPAIGRGRKCCDRDLVYGSCRNVLRGGRLKHDNTSLGVTWRLSETVRCYNYNTRTHRKQRCHCASMMPQSSLQRKRISKLHHRSSSPKQLPFVLHRSSPPSGLLPFRSGYRRRGAELLRSVWKIFAQSSGYHDDNKQRKSLAHKETWTPWQLSVQSISIVSELAWCRTRPEAAPVPQQRLCQRFGHDFAISRVQTCFVISRLLAFLPNVDWQASDQTRLRYKRMTGSENCPSCRWHQVGEREDILSRCGSTKSRRSSSLVSEAQDPLSR